MTFEFQSTPPVWGATDAARDRRGLLVYFNPRPPCGGRLTASRRSFRLSVFQSTPPVWGATMGDKDLVRVLDISIHAPRVGGDSW